MVESEFQTTSRLMLVANCPAPLGTSDFLRLTLTKEWTFCEFATSINISWAIVACGEADTMAV